MTWIAMDLDMVEEMQIFGFVGGDGPLTSPLLLINPKGIAPRVAIYDMDKTPMLQLNRVDDEDIEAIKNIFHRVTEMINTVESQQDFETPYEDAMQIFESLVTSILLGK